jgi:hypothetical protein
MKLAGVAVM